MGRHGAERILVFTDGAARGNPGPGGWGAIVLTPDGTVTELGGGSSWTTNNQMELTAAIEALGFLVSEPYPVDLYTDSTYVMRGMSQWIRAWQRRGWKTADGRDVLNRALWEDLSRLAGERPRSGRVAWHHVRGHANVPGNERADAIAVAHADGRPAELYRGPLRDYPVALRDIPEDGGTRPPAAARKKATAHSYLSLVDGRALRHATWAECEQRVKGRSSARFKKAISADDEADILRQWGVPPEALEDAPHGHRG